jgi:hypothetical protein
MVGERSRPWSPFFNSEQAIVKWPLVTRLLGEGPLNLDLDSLRSGNGRCRRHPQSAANTADPRGGSTRLHPSRRAWNVGQPGLKHDFYEILGYIFRNC